MFSQVSRAKMKLILCKSRILGQCSHALKVCPKEPLTHSHRQASQAIISHPGHGGSTSLLSQCCGDGHY